MATYYYPSNYGAAEFVGSGSAAGTQNFAANYQTPSTPPSYTVITPITGTSPQQYTVTTGYTGPGTGTTFTTVQTPYSDANHNETYAANIPGAPGPAYLVLTNGPVPSNYTYTFSSESTPFVPTGTTTDPTTTMCFVTGTRIATVRGDIPVEQLVVGDLAVTASGQQRPIKWIGHRTLGIRDVARTNGPVRISAHAFGSGLPARDLRLSPGHPVPVGADLDGNGGHLVPIMCLINGTSIARVAVETVTYWHIELDEHDLLLAEGLPAESYFDMGSRPWFAGDDSVLSDPDLILAGAGGRCLPVAFDGAVVEAERRRLDALFATNLAAQCDWPSEDAVAFCQ